MGIQELTAHTQLVRDRKLVRVLGSIQIVDELLVKLTVQRGSSGGHALHVERVVNDTSESSNQGITCFETMTKQPRALQLRIAAIASSCPLCPARSFRAFLPIFWCFCWGGHKSRAISSVALSVTRQQKRLEHTGLPTYHCHHN